MHEEEYQRVGVEADSVRVTNPVSPKSTPRQFSVLSLLFALAFCALGAAYGLTLMRLRAAERELAILRKETGYLGPPNPGKVQGIRLVCDEPLTFRYRVRVPENTSYRLVFSTLWRKETAFPEWYAAVGVPEGESTVIVRVVKDARDDHWKISALRRNLTNTRQAATMLPEDQIPLFRDSQDWLRSGLGYEPTVVDGGNPLRLLDHRMLVGEGSLMLYGDRPPETDTVGVFAELQPDRGPL